MNKFLSILGVLCLFAAVFIGQVITFEAESVLQIAVGFFGATLLIINAIKSAKVKDTGKLWVTMLSILAAVGGALCAIAKASESDVVAIISGAVALSAIVWAMIREKKSQT